MKKIYLNITSEPLDLQRIHALLDEDFHAFKRDYRSDPIPEEQELRAFLIEWFSVFLPEAVSDEFKRQIEEFLINARAEKSYRYQGWYSVLALEIALFVLTQRDFWLEINRVNLDHHKSTLRAQVIRSLILVADRLYFGDEELKRRTAHNLEAWHMYSDWSLILFAVTRGNVQDKKAQFQRWLEEYEHNENNRRTLESLIKGDNITNPFLSHLLWVQQYITLRLACLPAPAYAQISLPGMEISAPQKTEIKAVRKKPEQKTLFPTDSDLSLEDLLWKRLNNHPFMSSHISLEE